MVKGEQLAAQVSRASPRCLIIEDEPVIAADIKATLGEAGYSIVAIASTHGEALDQFRRHRPDVVVADIQLADGSSGIDAVHDILRVDRVPVLFLTAFPERLLLGNRPEPTYLITKPFQPETLVAAVDQALKKSSEAELPLKMRAVRGAASDALESVRALRPGAEPSHPSSGSGRNVFVSEAPFTSSEYQEVVGVLSELASFESENQPSPSQIAQAEQRLELASSQITNWASERLAQVQEGFFTQLGASLANWKFIVAAWVLLSGKLDAVVAALRALSVGN